MLRLLYIAISLPLFAGDYYGKFLVEVPGFRDKKLSLFDMDNDTRLAEIKEQNGTRIVFAAPCDRLSINSKKYCVLDDILITDSIHHEIEPRTCFRIDQKVQTNNIVGQFDTRVKAGKIYKKVVKAWALNVTAAKFEPLPPEKVNCKWFIQRD